MTSEDIIIEDSTFSDFIQVCYIILFRLSYLFYSIESNKNLWLETDCLENLNYHRKMIGSFIYLHSTK